jgi:malonyl-CoA/methylmalonyl-CoA synthetase
VHRGLTLLPIFKAQGIDLAWRALLPVKRPEVGMISPPPGMNVFVTRQVARAHVTLGGVFRGATLFVLADRAAIAANIVWPGDADGPDAPSGRSPGTLPPGRAAPIPGPPASRRPAMNPLFDTLFAPLAGQDRPLLLLPDGGIVTAGAFHALVGRAADALAALGVGPGDRVAVQLAKSVPGLAVYGAAVARGAVFLPLNTAYTADEVAYFTGNAEPRLILCDPARAAALAPVAAAAGARLETLEPAGGGSFGALAAAQTGTGRVEPRGEGDLAALLYTSGTTGRSKGAMLTQANLLSNAQALAGLWRFTASDVLLHALPVFHTHGLFVATNVTLLTGGAMIWLPAFDADEVLRLMPRATAMMGVPTFYTRLLDHPGLTRAATAHMRLFVSGSAPLLEATHAAFRARTGHAILERYGMTETNMIASNPYEGERRAGTVGFPLPGVEVRLTDPATGAPVPPGATGMIEVRGPNVFAGYWRMPEKTAEEMRADGFFVTGDLGQLDADGYLSIVGRAKDLIISGGLNVYPKEVELALDALPGVLESAVVGVPHPDFGEAVLAFVVPRPGAAPDPAALLAALRGRLAAFKLPKAVLVVESLPRNAMGKVQKAALRAAEAGRFAAPG